MGLTTVSQRYQRLSAERSAFLRIAEKCAENTIPYLFPKGRGEGKNIPSTQNIQYTSVGAEAVNFLANRLVNILFPPNKPFFRAKVPDNIIRAQDTPRADIERTISALEKTATDKFISSVSREHLLQACMNLIVGGNVVFIKQDTGSRYYSLYDYACKRATNDGRLLRLIIKEKMEIENVPTEYKHFIPESKKSLVDDYSKNNRVTLWTEAVWDNDAKQYDVIQYLDETQVLHNVYSEDDMPIMVLTWNLLSGDDYGHGFCEDYLGSLNSVGTLSQALTQLSLVVSRIINLVDPASELAFNIEDLKNASSGDFFVGKEGDVTQLVSNKLSDMQSVMSNYDMHTRQIQRVFLQNSAVQRDAERVTAEEIRYMANELETSQGGIYSHLAGTWQKHLARLAFLEAMEELGEDGKSLAKALDIQILTGLESLSRNIESESTLNFLQELSIFNSVPEAIAGTLNLPAIIKRLAFNSDIPEPQELLVEQNEVPQEPAAAELS